MAEEIEMLFDCAACMWCKPAKTHLLSKLPFDFVCKVVQFLSDRCEHRKHPPRFLNVQTDCFVLTHIISVIEIAGLACGTTFVGTIEEGRE